MAPLLSSLSPTVLAYIPKRSIQPPLALVLTTSPHVIFVTGVHWAAEDWRLNCRYYQCFDLKRKKCEEWSRTKAKCRTIIRPINYKFLEERFRKKRQFTPWIPLSHIHICLDAVEVENLEPGAAPSDKKLVLSTTIQSSTSQPVS
jgi:hypothetical protein